MNGLGNTFTITRRELSAYFDSAIAYIFMIVFISISVGLYMTEFFLAGRADMRSFFNSLPISLCIFLPAVTMRLWAEEKRGNTLELLLTFPMKTEELVAGKYLASVIFYLLSLLTTLTIPIMLLFLGKPDFGPIVGSYLGIFLVGAFFLAFGIFISGICHDQIVAFITTLIGCFLFVLVGTDFVAASMDGWIPGFGTFLKNSLGVLPHFNSFAKGTIDFKDLIYFSVGAAIFLILNGFWLEGRMRPKAKSIFASVAVILVAVFIAFNWLVHDLSFGRIDLTERKIYTVSNVTKQILKDLKAPALVKLYISPSNKMPSQLKMLEQEIIDKLDEFKLASNGKFDFKVIHMEAANISGRERKNPKEELSQEEQLLKKGIEPFQVQSIEADQMGVQLIYSAMSIAYKEKPEEVISQIIPGTLNELEYLILSKIYRMTLAEVPKIAVVAPYEDKALDPNMASILMQLGGGKIPDQYREDEFRLVPAALEYSGYPNERIKLTKEESIPEGTKTLIILNPKNFNERQRYEVNRFLVEGGSVLLGVQNYQFDYKPAGRRGVQVGVRPENPGINELISSWGLQVDGSILMDEQSDVISISGGSQMGPFAVSIPVKTPLQIVISQSGMNPNVSITSNLSPIFYLWGSALNLDDKKLSELKLTNTILLSSTNRSWKVLSQGSTLNANDFLVDVNGYSGPFSLAALVSGQFPNVFQDRKTLPLWPEERQPASEENAAEDAKELEKKATAAPELAPKPGKLLVVGASTIFKENLMGSGGGHLNFFLNAIDALTLGDELTKIRSKQEINRLTRRVSAPENLMWQVFTRFFIPILILLFWAVRFIIRRQIKQNYLRQV